MPPKSNQIPRKYYSGDGPKSNIDRRRSDSEAAKESVEDSVSSSRQRPLSDIREQFDITEYAEKNLSSLRRVSPSAEHSDNESAHDEETTVGAEPVSPSKGYFQTGPWIQARPDSRETMSEAIPRYIRSNKEDDKGGVQLGNSARNPKSTRTRRSSVAQSLPVLSAASEFVAPSYMTRTQSFLSKEEAQLEKYNKNKAKDMRRGLKRNAPVTPSDPQHASVTSATSPPRPRAVRMRKRSVSFSTYRSSGAMDKVTSNASSPGVHKETAQRTSAVESESHAEEPSELAATSHSLKDIEIEALRRSSQQAEEDRDRRLSENEKAHQQYREEAEQEIKMLKGNVEIFREYYERLQEQHQQLEKQHEQAKEQNEHIKIHNEQLRMQNEQLEKQNKQREKQVLAEKPKDAEPSKNELQSSESQAGMAPKTPNRHAEVVDEYAERCLDLERQRDALRLELAEEKQKQRALVEKSQGVAHSAGSESPNDEIDEKDVTWQKLYDNEKAAHQRLKKEYAKLRTKALKYDGPGLIRQNEELRDRLTALNDRYNLVEEKALNWQSEHKTIEEKMERESNAYETAIAALQDEILGYVKEYHDNLPRNNPDWWQVEALQKQLKKVERELNDRMKEKEKVQQQRDHAIAEFKKVRKAMEEGNVIHYATPFSGTQTKRIPRYECKAETEKRAKIIDALKQHRKKAREDEAAIEVLIEKARKYKMGSHYPPDKPGYEKLLRMSDRERWGLSEFLIRSSEEDWDEAVRLGCAPLRMGKKARSVKF